MQIYTTYTIQTQPKQRVRENSKYKNSSSHHSPLFDHCNIIIRVVVYIALINFLNQYFIKLISRWETYAMNIFSSFTLPWMNFLRFLLDIKLNDREESINHLLWSMLKICTREFNRNCRRRRIKLRDSFGEECSLFKNFLS